METKNLEVRTFRDSRGDIYRCLTFDVTEEIREMFGVPIKEAFAVYKKTDESWIKYDQDFWDNPPKTVEIYPHSVPNGLAVHAGAVQIPDMNEIMVVFDEAHTVRFWPSEWGGMERTDWERIDF